jgi:hypothetical protein
MKRGIMNASYRTRNIFRVFSRFDKLSGRYLGFVQFVSSLIWLR